MARQKDSKFIMKSNQNAPKTQSAFLAPRGALEKGKVSFPKKASAFLSSRGEPQKGKVSFKDGRYK